MMLTFALRKVIVVIAGLYAAILIVVLSFFDRSGLEGALIALRFAVALDIMLAIFAGITWRWLWRKVPKLNRWLYPDLNGKWQVQIQWRWKDKTGETNATAHIKQSLTGLSMHLVSDESESSTLCIVPKRDAESNQPLLFYIYKNEPRQGLKSKQDPHNGAALLKLDLDNPNLLVGNYFTDRATRGHYTMSRVK